MALTEKQKEYQRKYYEKKKAAGMTRSDEVRKREREYNQKYRDSHPEVLAEQRKRADPAKRRARDTQWRSSNKDKRKQYFDKWRYGKAAYDTAKARAKRKGLPFTITREYLNSITPTHCPVLGIELVPGAENKDHNISIDRIIPELGYVEGNIIIVSFRANRLRSDGTIDELKRLSSFYEKLISATE